MKLLPESDLVYMNTLFSNFSNIQEVWLFGSRAKGTNQKGSDVDIALKGDDLSSVVTEVSGILNEESPLPYYFDVLNYEQLTNKNLKEHIDRVGQRIYSRSKNTKNTE